MKFSKIIVVLGLALSSSALKTQPVAGNVFLIACIRVACHAGLGTVWVFDVLGRPVYGITAPKGLGTTNCAFGGKDNETLFITESDTGSILKAQFDISGKTMFSGYQGE